MPARQSQHSPAYKSVAADEMQAISKALLKQERSTGYTPTATDLAVVAQRQEAT